MADFSTFGFTEPVYSLEAEQSVLGSILLEPTCFTTVLEHIKVDSFYREQNRAVFEAFTQLFAENTPIDAVTTINALKGNSAFSSTEDAKVYIVSLMQVVPSAASVEHYCKIVEDKYIKRTLMAVAQEIIAEATSDSVDANLLLDSAEQKIFDIREGKNVSGMVTLKEAIYEAYDNLAKLTGPDREKYEGLKTGFSALDDVTTGFGKSDLILLAARPGIGKTSFALNIATNIARKYPDRSIAIFSLEMSSEQLALRIMSSESLVDSEKMRKGALSGDDWENLYKAAEYLSSMNIYLDDTAAATVLQMKSKLRRMKNLGFVIIDYLQLMSSGKPTENRVAEVSAMTRNLKIMAKELNVPVLLLSQLNRGPDTRKDDHRPKISDLRESGSIEQDADSVLFLYKESKYDPSANPADAECIIAKNRHGRTDTVPLRWDGEHTRFITAEIFRDYED